MYNSPNDPHEITMEEGQALTLTLRGTLTSIPVTSYRWKYVFGDEHFGREVITVFVLIVNTCKKVKFGTKKFVRQKFFCVADQLSRPVKRSMIFRNHYNKMTYAAKY